MENEYLFIDDIAFEAVVKDALNLTDKDDILLSDVDKIRKLDLMNLEISTIKGIENFKRLSSLKLSNNDIDDLSYLTELKLDFLDVSYLKNCKSFECVGDIKTIKTLNLSGNWVESFDFLENLPKLEILYINDMGFDDFSELPPMENLKKLYIEDNLLEDIEKPPYLPEIKELYLSRNKLIYIDGIQKLKTLEKIRISYNKIETISPLKSFKKLKKLYMSYNQIVDLSPLENMEITEKLALDGNHIVDVNPIKHLINSDLDIFGMESTGIIRPTKEQRDIVNYSFDENDILKVNAYAGTGKTTTAIKFIENYKIPENRKILYLTFNKAVKDDIDRKMPNKFKKTVEIRTTHSFAWKYLKLNNSKFYQNIYLTTTAIRDYLYFNMSDKKEALKNARLIEQFVKFYLNSRYSYQPEDIKAAFENFFEYDERVGGKTDSETADLLVNSIKILVFLLNEHRNGRINFDFYLKLFHLTLRNYISLMNNTYQLVIFDEAQDASMVMFDSVDKMTTKKIFIGDGHQEIYSFRHAVNILNRIETDALELTNSFRFGKNIAELANKILSLKGVKTKIKGKGDDKILFYNPKEGLITPKSKFAVISRTNIPLFDYAYEAAGNGKKLYFEGGLDNYPFATVRAKSIYYLFKREYGKIKDAFIRQFNNIWKLKNYAFEVQDFQLYGLADLIEKYGEDFYKVFLEIKSKVVEEKSDADIIFTTVHKSKGVEYDIVMVVEDFKVEPFKSNNDYEEVNMLYVAVTRAKKVLYLPQSYDGFPDINIEEIIKVVNEPEDNEILQNPLKVKVDLHLLTDFEKALNKLYRLPMSKNASTSPEKLAIAINMIKMGLPLSSISQAINIDIEILKNLQ